MKGEIIVLCLSLILCATSGVFATTWYVDKDAFGSNNGTSWTNAWESFADISWTSVSSGDTVYISGGSTSKTYYETLTISKSFTSNTTVKRGVDSGHDGDVKIDGGGSRSNCIKITGDYITVDGFHAEDATSYDIYLDGPDHVTVRNCSIHIVSGGRNAIHMRNGTDLTIENNTITTYSGSWSEQSDGITSGHNEDVVIRNNSITLRNGSTQHNDCMQMWNTKNVEVYNNYGNQPQDASNQQGIYIEGIYTDTDLGTWKVYNNVIEGYFGTAISLQQKNDTAVMHCYNNTAKNLKSRPYAFDGDNVYFKNNIGINTDSIRVAVFESSTQSTSRINYNCYYGSGSGDIVTKGGTGYTWSEWQSAGFDGDGINQNPSLDSNLKPDSSSDPVVNAGTSLSSHFTTDKDGTSRPQGSAWDMGAYEYTSGGDTTPPSPNPMTWATEPYATGTTSISMTATTATDSSGVEYYFDCTAGGGNDSGWQDSTTYEDTGLDDLTQYTYRVRARDKSSNQNATSYSTTKSATTQDGTAPSPDPMTWATEPYATGTSSISMTATTATDVSGVEYYFDCTAGGGNDSGWQDSTTYEDTGLSPETQYTYRVRARDKSSNQNATSYSTSKSATTDAEADTTPPSPDPMTWATEPYATGTSSVSMTATTATDPCGVEYYFDETSGNPGGSDSGWQDSTTYEDTGLSELTEYTYRVKARDKSSNQNETAYSTTKSATTQDGTAPSPDPMTWATDPYATGTSSISMTATTATDASGVEYYFDCTAGGGNDSGWQDSATYEDTGLSTSTQYTYRVKSRDKSGNQNETGYSTTKSATTDAETELNLVSWWKLDESSGTTASDSSGNNHDGTRSGGSWAPTSGKFDGAVELGTDANDHVEVPTTSMSASTGTVSVWGRIEDTQSGTRYFFGHTSTPGSWVNRIQLYMDDDNNQLDLGLGDSHSKDTNIMTLSANTWYHIALTWDSGNYVVYVDGLSKASGTYTGLSTLGSVADIGNTGNSSDRTEAFQGKLDDVCVYDQALSKYDVADLAGITIASSPSPADEATGVATDADLSWSAGYYAASTNGHDVYFGTDFNSVADANHSSAEFKGNQSSTTYDPGTMSNSTTYYWAIDEVNDSNTWAGNVWSFTTEAAGDTTPPSPDSMTWATEPYATGSSSISMTATTATDASGVEYYFDCTAGGGSDSGWQDSTTYQDTGLSASTQYTYRVKARDKSGNQNETGYSTSKSATTDAAGATGYKVQSGRVEVTDTTKDVSITAVSDLSRAFVLLSPGTGHANQGSNADEAQIRGWLQATNNIRIARTVSEDNTWVSYQVIECLDEEFTVYRGSSSMTSTQTSKTLSIGGTVTAANCLALVTADNDTDSQDYYSQAMLTARVSSSTQVTIEREDSGDVAPNFNWVVVEFDTGKIDSIQHGSVTVDDEMHSSPKTATISSIDTDDSILIFQARPSMCSLERSNFAGNITSSTQIEFYQHDDGAGYGDIEWYVIDFGGGTAQRGEVDNSSGSWLITNVTISSVDTSHTMCFHTMTCDGSGVAFTRPFATTEFTSSTNLRIERKYSGQDTWNEWQVLELPNTE